MAMSKRRIPKEDRDFLKQVIVELKTIPSESDYRDKIYNKSSSLRGLFFLFCIVFLFCLPRIIQGLTPVEILTERIHENSKYKFNGSICNDGHISHSQGQGSCSWHGGVNSSFEKGEYSKSIDECRTEAVKLSWRTSVEE